jgi:pyruvate dehydrogenase E1 component alpha subunit
VDGNDLDTVIAEFRKAADRARRGEGPSYIVADTYRFRGHSMSDAMKYRTKEEMEKAKSRDPISIYEIRLREKGLLTEEQIDQMQDEVNAIVAEAIRQADADPHPDPEERFEDILSESYPYEPKESEDRSAGR